MFHVEHRLVLWNCCERRLAGGYAEAAAFHVKQSLAAATLFHVEHLRSDGSAASVPPE
jgi:hypothetical protein